MVTIFSVFVAERHEVTSINGVVATDRRSLYPLFQELLPTTGLYRRCRHAALDDARSRRAV